MCSLDSPAECMQGMMTLFTKVASYCSKEMAELMTFLESLPSVCEDEDSVHQLHKSFLGHGTFANLVRCAVSHDENVALYAGVFDPGMFRQFMCVDQISSQSPQKKNLPKSDMTVSKIMTILILLGMVLMAVGYMWRRGEKFRRRRTLINVWWFTFFSLCMPLSFGNTRVVDPADFMVRDDVTSCAFDVERMLPRSVAKDQTFTVIAPLQQVHEAYKHVMHTPLEVGRLFREGSENTTLAEQCGGCAFLAWNRTHMPSVPLMKDLIVGGGTYPSGSGDVAFSVRMPMTTTKDARRNYLRTLSERVSDKVVFAHAEQAVVDSERSASPDPAIVVLSMTTMVVLAQFAARIYVEKGAWPVTLSIVFMLSGVITTADAFGSLLGIPFSPFNVLAFPLVVGTGMDSLFLMLHQRGTGARDWIARAQPSIVASQLSTTTCFAIGALVNVPHIRNFFLYLILCVLISLVLQLTWFPSVIVSFTRVKVHEGEEDKKTVGMSPLTREAVSFRASHPHGRRPVVSLDPVPTTAR